MSKFFNRNQIIYKSREEIELMREAAQIVSRTLGKIGEAIEPGITTMELDKIAEDYILSQKAKPGFKGLYDCPSTLLTSVNEQVVHGLPSDYKIKEGDIVSCDCGSIFEGFYGDHCYTFAVGKISDEAQRLLDVTMECLNLGIQAAHAGNRIGDIGYAVQEHAESNGYGVVRDLVGHGLGRKMHEEPQVPNYGRRGTGKKIQEGLVIAIEPMINIGTHEVIQAEDGWTIVTADNKWSCHFEHDVAIVDGKPDVLSTFEYAEEAMRKKGWLKK